MEHVLRLGWASEVGSLEPGKSADLTCIDLDMLGSRPATDAAAAIVFGATRAQVSDVWSAGRAAVSEGRLRLFDEEELAAIASRWAQRLALEAAAGALPATPTMPSSRNSTPSRRASGIATAIYGRCTC